ncbi:MAG: hypothetical protein M1819_003124 [Sarea resinae]|nr:MAG: hypothetical protein M1819_003124 [Sarea resinae]
METGKPSISARFGFPTLRRRSKQAQQSPQSVPITVSSGGKSDQQGQGITVITRLHAQDQASKTATSSRHTSASWKDKVKSPQQKALPDLPTVDVPRPPQNVTSPSPTAGPPSTLRRKPANLSVQAPITRRSLEGKARDGHSGSTSRAIQDRKRSLPSSSPRRVSLQPIDELTSSGPDYPKHHDPRTSQAATRIPRKVSGTLPSHKDVSTRAQQKLHKTRPQETGRRQSAAMESHSMPVVAQPRLSSRSAFQSPSTPRTRDPHNHPLPPLPPGQAEIETAPSRLLKDDEAMNEKIPVESEQVAPVLPSNTSSQLPQTDLQPRVRISNAPTTKPSPSPTTSQPQMQDWKIRPLPPLDMNSASLDIDHLKPPLSPTNSRQSDRYQHGNQSTLSPQRTHSRGKSSSGYNVLNKFMNTPANNSSETPTVAVPTAPTNTSSKHRSSSVISVGSPAPGLTDVHLSCFQSHRSMAFSRNHHAPVACMTCRTEDDEPRWRCTWCCLRICRGCLDILESCDGRALGELKRKLES